MRRRPGHNAAGQAQSCVLAASSASSSTSRLTACSALPLRTNRGNAVQGDERFEDQVMAGAQVSAFMPRIA